MLVLPTQPRGGSVMFSFSSSSCTACATTPTASLMCADSFLPLMSCSPMMPARAAAQRAARPPARPRPGPARPGTHRRARSAARSPRSRARPPATRTPSPSCSAWPPRGTRWRRRPRCGQTGVTGRDRVFRPARPAPRRVLEPGRETPETRGPRRPRPLGPGDPTRRSSGGARRGSGGGAEWRSLIGHAPGRPAPQGSAGTGCVLSLGDGGKLRRVGGGEWQSQVCAWTVRARARDPGTATESQTSRVLSILHVQMCERKDGDPLGW